MNKGIIYNLLALLVLTGCSSVEPWVKPYERQSLADPLMSFDSTPAATSFVQHMLHSREAARGAEGGEGGGCGCN